MQAELYHNCLLKRKSGFLVGRREGMKAPAKPSPAAQPNMPSQIFSSPEPKAHKMGVELRSRAGARVSVCVC